MLYQLNPMTDEPGDTSGFAAGLLNPDVATPDHVVGPNNGKADKRYNVYRNNVTVSLINAVVDIFPGVQKIVGEEYFRAMAREYVRAHPPSSPLLFLYGQDFADFIEGFEPAKKLPYLADVARAERGWLTAYHAADVPPLDAAKLGLVDPARLGDVKFLAHPATCLVKSPHPVHDIFLMNRDFMPVAPLDMSVAQNLMLTRPETDTRVVIMDEGEAAFFSAILDGQTLGEAAAEGSAVKPDFDLNTSLTMLLGTGATRAITLDEEEI